MKKQSISYRIGEELLDEALQAVLAAIMLIFGVGYFNIKDNWTEAVKLLAQKEGAQGAVMEVGTMYSTVTNSAFFTFFKVHGDLTLVILSIIAVIGLALKFMTERNKGTLIKDLGKIIIVPGIVGVISLLIIQLLTVNTINDLFAASKIDATATMLTNLDSSFVIFNMMGVLFLMGLMFLIIGSIIYFVIRKLGGKPVWLLLTSKLLTFLGAFAFGFFLLIRILAIEEISMALTGNEILKVFAFAWYITRDSFMVSLIVFGFGYVLYTYGKDEERLHRIKMKAMLDRERINAIRWTPSMPQRNDQYSQNNNQSNHFRR